MRKIQRKYCSEENLFAFPQNDKNVINTPRYSLKREESERNEKYERFLT